MAELRGAIEENRKDGGRCRCPVFGARDGDLADVNIDQFNKVKAGAS